MSPDIFLGFLSGHICVGFTLCSGPVRLSGSYSDGPVSLGLQPHRKDPCGLSIRRAGTKVMSQFLENIDCIYGNGNLSSFQGRFRVESSSPAQLPGHCGGQLQRTVATLARPRGLPGQSVPGR